MGFGTQGHSFHPVRFGDIVDTQNVDNLFFAGDDKLENGFDELYSSLFTAPKPYLKVITALGKVKSGMTRDEIAKAASLANNGALTKRLRELEQCGFVRKFVEIGRGEGQRLFEKRPGVCPVGRPLLLLKIFRFC